MFDSIIILAGGESSRFWPLSDKNVLPFVGKSLIISQVEKLATYSNNLVIVANKKNHQNIDLAIKQSGLPAIVVTQIEKGQSAAILSARSKAHGKTLVVNANDIFSATVLSDIEKKVTSNDDGAIVAQQMSEYFPGGYVIVKNGYVSEIIEKPALENVPSNLVKLVVDCLLDIDDFMTVLDGTSSENDDVYEKAISTYISKGKKIVPVVYESTWLSLKYPWHVLDGKDYFLSSIKSKQGSNVTVAESAVLKGEVYLDDNVVVHEFVTIIGPVYIGKNSVIGTYSMVRDSMIGSNCLIGSYCEVTRSYLGDKVYLHRNYIGDSVFEHNILVGADALTANYRFDQKTIRTPIKGQMQDTKRQKLGAIVGSNSKIGVNSSIMPGVKIESGVFINPQSKIERDCYRSEIK